MSHEHSVEFERDGEHYLYSSHIDGRRLEGEELKKAYRQGLLKVIGGPYTSREDAQKGAEERSAAFDIPKQYIPILRREGIPEKGIQKFLWEQSPKGPLAEWPVIQPPLSGLSKEASEFLRKLTHIIDQYTPALAKPMFTEEYGSLSASDKQALNNYLGIK